MQYATMPTSTTITFINLRTHEGMLRNMIVRTSTTGELMVILICKIEKEEEMALFKQMLQYIADTFPEITSLLYIINNKCNDTITDLEVHTFKGKDHIFEEMEGLRFKVGPKSFYQTNSEQAYNLYKVARNFAGLTGNELVYDLYTGTGTIANFVSKHARQVIGIEYVPEAIEDAKVNAEINGIKNTLFFAGDMKDICCTSPATMESSSMATPTPPTPARLWCRERLSLICTTRRTRSRWRTRLSLSRSTCWMTRLPPGIKSRTTQF